MTVHSYFKLVDHVVDTSDRHGRVDIHVGVGRRRRWSAEEKGRIVAESYAPGAGVSEVARRHEICPQHLGGAVRSVGLPPDERPMFVPIVTTADRLPSDKPQGRGLIEIAIAGAVVHAEPGVDLGWLRDVLAR